MHDPCGAGRSGLFTGPSAAFCFKLRKGILGLAYDRFSNKMNVTESKQEENMDQTNETKILVVDDEAESTPFKNVP